MTSPEPVVFGRYLLEQKLASGGMGEIFLARMEGAAGFEKKVVIKRILPHLAESEEFVERFLDEGRLVVQLSHGNIVQVLDMGEVEGHYYLAMEYVDGLDLRQVQRRLQAEKQQIPIELAMFVVAQVATGLAYAHSRTDDEGNNLGIIHRDVSPSNVMITRGGEVKLLDFGIAKAASRMAHSISGSLHGKFLYMSPEQASGQTLDRRSDLFSLGIIAYELLTGKRPFQGDTELKTLDLIRGGEHVRSSELREDIPPEVEAIVERCLARDPDKRYRSAEDLHRAVLKYLIDSRQVVSHVDLAGLVRPLMPRRTPTQPVTLDQALNQELDALLGGPSSPTPSSPTHMRPRGSSADLPAVGSASAPPLHTPPPESSTTSRARLSDISDAPIPRASRNRILIASVILLVGVLVTLNVVMLTALRSTPESAAPPPPEGPRLIDGDPPVPVAVEGTDGTSLVAMVEDAGTTEEPAPNVEEEPEDAGEPPDAAEPAEEPEEVEEPEPEVVAPPPEPMRVQLTDLPDGATVELDGREVQLEDGRLEIPEGEGPVELTIDARGHHPRTLSIERQAGLVVKSVELQERRRTIQVTTVPDDATITIGKKKLGTGSATLKLAGTDTARLRVSRPGYETYQQTLSTLSPSDLTVELKPKAMGRFKVRVLPVAYEVRVDGRRIKRSKPIIEVQVPPGGHTLTVHGPDGQALKTRTFSARANETENLGTIEITD